MEVQNQYDWVLDKGSLSDYVLTWSFLGPERKKKRGWERKGGEERGEEDVGKRE